MLLSQALQGAILWWEDKGLSDRTIEGYTYKLSIFIAFTGDVEMGKILPPTIQGYFSYLRAYRKANGRPLAPRTILQHWTSLRSFYAFLATLGYDNPMAAFPPPSAPSTSDVEPFTQNEVSRLLAAVKPVRGNILSLRDRAIILVLLDVGLRNAELRNLRVKDYHDGRIHIIQGKGNKDRFVYLGKKSSFAVWQYLAERGDVEPDSWLFARKNGRQLERQELNRYVTKKIGIRAGVENCHPHRFRHTCAVLRIIAGESAEMLMHVLGHTTINMVLYYVKLAKMDTRAIQRRVSPMDNMK